ncbi:hypothetical protein [Clostridium sp. HBUAS56017]|uniref:hypothetical protein n=1 Tax=Clostridium sp. HBUAS56017 TaxID=2571128 RepID=UPI0011776DDE|nr:hypothetical protein [Clostridium sp. HBUAS56017]
MNNLKVILSKWLAVATKTTMTKVVTGVVVVGIAGGTTTAGVIAYKNSQQNKEKSTYSNQNEVAEESYEEEVTEQNQETSANKVEEIKPEEKQPVQAESTEQKNDKTEDSVQAQQPAKQAQQPSKQPQQSPKQAQQPQPTQPNNSTPKVIKPAGIDWEITRILNEGGRKGLVEVEKKLFAAIKEYAISKTSIDYIYGKYPCYGGKIEISGIETETISVPYKENVPDYYYSRDFKDFTIEDNRRLVGHFFYQIAAHDGKGNVIVTEYRLLCHYV